MKKNYKLFTSGLIAIAINSLNAQCPIPSLVTASPSTICAGSTTSLNATASSSSISWFTLPSGGVSIGSSATGSNFAISPTVTTTYYAESFVIAVGSTTLNYTGAMQTYTVPLGITSLTLEAYGAQGANSIDKLITNAVGGLGGYTKASMAVTPGQVLYVYVGGAGNISGAGGFNGGGNGGLSTAGGGCSGGYAGGGGGASDVRFGGLTLSNRILVASGGGASGRDYCNGSCIPCGCGGSGGDGGGLSGINGFAANNCGFSYPGTGTNFGGFGSQVSGGNFGLGDGGGVNGTVGSLGIGGDGATGGYDVSGGGGGGGFYGGGGGGGASSGSGVGGGGGGGGSSYYGTLTSPTLLNGVKSGDGQVIITGSGVGCTSVSRTAITVTVNTIPTIAVNSGSICSGKSFTMIPSGASSYTYSSGSAIVSPLTNTSYSVTGTSALGCVGSNTAVSGVTVIALPVISVNSGSICAGNSFTMTPSGASTYTYTGGSAIVSPSLNSTYTVTGLSVSGCTNTAVSSVTVNALPVVSVNSGSICNGSSFTMIPTGGITYTYSSGAAAVAPSANSTYTVTGASAAGCLGTAVSSVTVNPLPTIAVNSGSICSGSSFTMVPSGAGTYTYSGGSAVVSPLTNTSYSVTGTSALGCVGSNTAVSAVVVNATPTLSINSGSICAGSSFTMIPSGASSYSYSSGSAIVTPTANTSYSVTGISAAGCVASNTAISTVTVNAIPTLSVNNGAICEGSSFTMTPSGATTYTYSSGSSVVTPTTSTSYTVSGTSVEGCLASLDVVSSVTVDAIPTLTVNSGAICDGGSFTITPSGAATYTYSSGSAIVTPTANTSYSVSGTSPFAGCVSAISAVSSVTVNANPTLLVVSNNSVICAGETASLTVSGASTYTWNTAETTTVIAVTPSVTSTYSLTGVNSNGCSSSASFTQTVNACVGLQNLTNDDLNITIYPNPNNGVFTIELNTTTQVIITNVLGDVLLNSTFNNGKQILDIQNKANGIYFVKMIQNSKQQTIKLIKE
jgi:hypothetical protein